MGSWLGMPADGAGRVYSRRLPVRRPVQETFAASLDAAITSRRRTMAGLRRALLARGVRVSSSTLSYWRSGERQPEGASSLEAVAVLEDLLDVPRGHLLDRIGPARRRVPGGVEIPSLDLMELPAEQRESLAETVMDGHEFVELTSHVTVDVDGARRIERAIHRSLVRAVVDGADRIPLFLRLERPSDRSALFRARAGGRIVDGVDVAPDFYVGAFVLERALRLGETALVEYEMAVPEADGFHLFEQHAVRRTNEILIWVRFAPDALPRRVEAYRVKDDVEEVVPIVLDGASTAHHVTRSFGPGTMGIRWQW